jgi:hypothetical protein
MMLFLFIFFLTHSLVASKSYCATFDADTTSGSVGSFSMEISEGVASYRFYLDLTNFKTECILSSGLGYHIHSYWVNTTTQSSANAFCGKSLTGNHFDPNLACSTASQSSGSGGLCAAISRTSPDYTYSCSNTNYQKGDYSMCEVGDLSGKFGKALESSTDGTAIFSQQDILSDYVPAYDFNYLTTSDPTSIQWASMVFHCADGTSNNGARLVCAKFLLEDSSSDSSCGSAPSTSSSGGSNSWKITEWGDLTKLLLALAVVFVFVASIFAFRILRMMDIPKNNIDDDVDVKNSALMSKSVPSHA